jgi:hypothetical protein
MYYILLNNGIRLKDLSPYALLRDLILGYISEYLQDFPFSKRLA